MEYPKIIAHRGLHGGDVCENSLTAFRRAAERSIAVELDVRLTKDCRLVVFHDKNLLRMTGVDAMINDFTYEQLCALPLKGSGERIPLLKDVLKTIDGKVPVFIELKSGTPSGVAEKRLIKLLSSYKGEYAVMSFDLRQILYLRIFAPQITRGVLLSRFKSKPCLEYIARLITASPHVWSFFAKPDFIACDLRSADIRDIIAAFNREAAYISWTAKGDELFNEASRFSRSVIFEDISESLYRQNE